MKSITAIITAFSLLAASISSPEFFGHQNCISIYAETNSSTSVYEYITDDYKLLYRVNGKEATIHYCNYTNSYMPAESRQMILNLEIPEKINGYTVTEINDSALDGILYKNLILPDTIKRIGNKALGSYTYAPDTFTFPRDTEEIGDNVFSTLNSDKIVLPANVRSISKNAFPGNFTFEVDPDNKYFHISQNLLMTTDNKTLLKYSGTEKALRCSIPESVETINPHAFDNANVITVDIPDSVRTIGEYAFHNSTIKSVSLPDSIETIGKSAFQNSNINSLTFPDSITVIEDNTFAYCCELKNVQLSKNLESIGSSAFFSCTMLESIVLPDSLKEIQTNAFSKSGVSGTINISSYLSKISPTAFSYTNIAAYDVSEDNTCYSSQDNILFDRDKTTVIHCPPQNSKTSVYLPETVTKIENNAFYQCVNLKNITIPDSIKEIGSNTFYQCTSLKSVKLPANLSAIKSEAFSGCSDLHEIDLPSGIETIGEKAFAKTALKTISIPESATKISSTAFSDCSDLKTIKVSPYFHDFKCYETDITIEFYDNKNLYISDGIVYSKDKSVLINYPLFTENYMKEFTVPEYVTKIESNAFENLDLRKITLSKNISSIGDYAFKNCKRLQEFDYNGSDPELGKGTFYGCPDLYRIELPSSIRVIPEDTFYECTNIQTARIPDGIEELESYCMPCVLNEVYIPSSVTKISENAFGSNYGFLICGEEGSYAEKFAAENQLKFVADSKKYNGDINNDGKTNIIDLITLKSCFINSQKNTELNSDVNKDGILSVTDLVKLINILHGQSEPSGYGDIEFRKEILDCEVNKYNITPKYTFITSEEELTKVFNEYFVNAETVSSYVDKYKDYLDEYVIYTYLHKSASLGTRPAVYPNIYGFSDSSMIFFVSDIQFFGFDSFSSYLYTVLLPKNLYTGQYVDIRTRNNENIAYKPVIYLYPEEETTINVKVELDEKSRFTCTYPEYPEETGWTVTAEPDSTLYDENGSYPYLFWEAATSRDWDMSEGFVVKGEDTKEFLKEKLSFLGLEPVEYIEFISFWLPKMENNKYNLISFQTDDYEEMAKLTITPEPESVLRVFMTYKSLDEWEDIPEQNLSSFERKGYTVVEWGGSEVK